MACSLTGLLCTSLIASGADASGVGGASLAPRAAALRMEAKLSVTPGKLFKHRPGFHSCATGWAHNIAVL